MSNAWPRLSADLPKRAELHACRSCGGNSDLARWLEHDGADEPEPIVVVLCKACADRLIEPHPRLYRKMTPFEPFPGVMSICGDCRLRDGQRCTNAQAKINGGPGLAMTYPAPTRVHYYRRGKGAKSGWETIWNGPVTSCAGKEPIDADNAVRSAAT